MALTGEWIERILAWRKELEQHFYRHLGGIELSGFTTFEHLTYEQAMQRRFKPMPDGTPWGRCWEYGWFKGRVTLPAEARGRRVVLNYPGQDEAVLFLNGRAAGARNWAHPHPTLTHHGQPGQVIDLVFEAYAGHGPHPADGPVPPERRYTWHPPAAMKNVTGIGFGLWDEGAFQLHFDLETLWSLRQSLDPLSLRVSEIDKALREVALIIDFEAPYAQRLQAFAAARKRLAPLLACRNGSTAPDFFCFGHGHLDTAWLWPLAETERKTARTLTEQLNLIREYPGYRFLLSQPAQYAMLKQHYPELYRRIKKAVADGSIIADGGMWVEADTNITGGESLIRQFLHGKRFFRDELGTDSRVMWLPDVFGYSGALPQIMKGCGIDYFSTSKIFWNYHGGEDFPYHNFIWQGIDGTGIVAHFHDNYNSSTDPQELIGRWNHRHQRDDMTCRLVPFGWGDGGGGPTRQHLELLARQKDLEGAPRCRIASPQEFFVELEKRGEHDVNRYVGELYFQCHRGTYTSQARTKLGNRSGERALREAEMWGTVAIGAGFDYPAGVMDATWKRLLLNQFHDIIPGSSIQRVYQEAEADYERILKDATAAADAARRTLAHTGRGSMTVFNSLNWDRTVLVELPAGSTGATDGEGTALPVQTDGDTSVVEVSVPSCGSMPLHLTRATADGTVPVPPEERTEGGRHKNGTLSLENEFLKAEFNSHGELTRLFDKESGRDVLSGRGNCFKLFKDVPVTYEAWDITRIYESEPVPLSGPALLRPLAKGPLFSALHLARRVGDSTLSQEIHLRRNSRRIDFITTIDWRERHRLLKVGFDVNIHADEAVHEIQFGHLRRPTHRSRQYDKDRFEVCQQKWTALTEEARGVAILNDCKYGIHVLGNSMNLTLLRSPCTPDPTADRGIQTFTYSLYAWNGSLADSGVVREAYDLNMPSTLASGNAGLHSWIRTDAPNVVIEAVKPAEDGSGDVIVRLYETMRTATRCTLTTTLAVSGCRQADMLENPGRRLPMRKGAVTLDLRPFEIVTLRMRRQEA